MLELVILSEAAAVAKRGNGAVEGSLFALVKAGEG